MKQATCYDGRRARVEEVVYRTVCQNPGCRFVFDLIITRSNVGILGSRIACPRCQRQGGALESGKRLGARLFSSRLMFQ